MSMRDLRRHVGQLAIAGFAGHSIPADLRTLARARVITPRTISGADSRDQLITRRGDPGCDRLVTRGRRRGGLVGVLDR